MEAIRRLFAAAIIILATADSALSFDIAIYNDPLSFRNGQFQYDCRHGYWTNPATREADSTALFSAPLYTAAMMDSVYRRYEEMGVTHVMVNYPYPANFDWITHDSTHVKVMNWFYPGLNSMYGAKYVDAQFRNVQVGLVWPDPEADWSYETSIGEGATRISDFNLNGDIRPVVTMLDTNAGVMWLPTSDLSNFSGWDYYNTGWLDSSLYMPMHYRLTWAVDPNGSITTATPLADFYWIVRAPDDTTTGEPRWWRFPGQTLTLDSLADTTHWITTNFYESAHEGIYHKLDSNFAVIDSVPWNEVTYDPARPPRSLDDYSYSDINYSHGTPVRMAVWYRGIHGLYLNRIDVFDEGYWRMFVSDDSSDYQDSIADAFDDEFSAAGGKSAGWYYDEWDLSDGQCGKSVIKSIVKVNGILQGNTPPLPAFIMNGYTCRDMSLYPEELNQGVSIPVQMNEFYFLGASHTCQPKAKFYGWETPIDLWTDSSSDVAYLDVDFCGTFIYGNGAPQGQFDGQKSLQCAIDGSIWDWNPIMGIMAEIDESVWGPWQPYQRPPNYCLLPDVAEVHGNDDKYWALIAGSSDKKTSEEIEADNNCCPIRDPEPNEVSLMAWLAVACDVDGIMWYPWEFGGLMAWDTTTNDFETVPGRYEAARKTCTEIKEITPILESLTFVKTYASRAFELEYPDSTYEATQRDVLATDTWWYGDRPYRCVNAVYVWAPDPNGPGGWSETPDENPYVQISRFRNPLIPLNDPTVEDYWFLIVNRRALDGERRKVRLEINVDTTYLSNPYYLDYILGDSTKSAEPCAEKLPTCANRYLDVILQPGEAEFVHFYRGEFGCDTTWAHIDNLAAIPSGPGTIQLNWEEITESDDGFPFEVSSYFIMGSPRAQGPYTPIASTPTNSYVDSIFAQYDRYYYQVQACGEAPHP